jgi:UDP-N-acetylglucosamine--N-acetylmuramyl-(pentapeptide) pyrophosphoryl-undecaprenol N-acetylglucosamine transferase
MVFLFTGGSGGHIRPALVLKEKLEQKGLDVLLFLPRPDRKFISNLKDKGIRTLRIARVKYKAIIQLPFICLQLLSLYIIYRPKVILGFGGFFSIPGILIGKLFGTSTLLYEPNLRVGRANRFLSPWVDKILCVWGKEVKGEIPPSKILKVQPLVVFKSSGRVEKNSFTILITGGSQGSAFLNELILDLFKFYDFEETGINFVLITGREKYLQVKDKLKAIGKAIPLNVLDYVDNMEAFYKKADFLIARAGAQTVFEVIFYQIPALLVPYPYAYGHQLQNAQVLFERGASLLLQQHVLNPESLGKLIIRIHQDKRLLSFMKERLSEIKRELWAGKKIEEILEEIDG